MKQITVVLSDAQVAALELMQVSSKESAELATNAFTSRIKSKMENYIFGNRLPEEKKSEATYILTKKLKSGKVKTIYFKGGLREEIERSYGLAKEFLPKEITKEIFVEKHLKAANDVYSVLSAVGETSEDEDEAAA